MQYNGNNVKCSNIKLNNKIFGRCRWSVQSKHLWNVLNSYGCVPKKSLILKFPSISIFDNKNLIVHFIRGYFDGDGCISYGNKSHTKCSINIVGTYDFLNTL
jgi:intein/homing endonuclease